MSYLSKAQSFGSAASAMAGDGSGDTPPSSSVSYLTNPAAFYIIVATGLCITYCAFKTKDGKMDSWWTRSMICGWVIISLLAMSTTFGTWEAIKMGEEAPPVIAGFFIAYCVTLSISSSMVYCVS